MGAIFGCHPAVVDGLGAAVRRLCAARVRPGPFFRRALTDAHRAIIGASVEVAGRVVTRFRFSVTQFGRDVTLTRCQPGLPMAHRRQLVGLGILAVPGRLGAIVGCNLAVVDRLGAAISSLCAPRVRPGTCVCGAPTVARRAIPCHSVKITRRVVTRFGLSVTQLGREVARPRSQPGDFAVLGGLRAIFGCELAVVDCLGAVDSGFSTPRRGLGTFVRGILAVASRTIPSRSVEITRRVVARFGFSVPQPGRDVTVLRSQPGFAAPHSSQLVGPGIFEVLGGLGAIFGCHPSVVDGLGAVVRSPSATRGGPGAFVGRMLTVARRAITRGSVEITRGVVTRFGLSVTQPGRDITILRSQPGLSAALAGQLVSSGIFPVPGGLYAIFGRNLPVMDGLRAVVRSLNKPRGSYATFAGCVLALACRAVPGGSVEVARSVIARLGLTVTLLGLTVTNVGSPIAVTPFYVALARGGEGVLASVRATRVLIWSRHATVGLFAILAASRHSRAPVTLQPRPFAITIAATALSPDGFGDGRLGRIRPGGQAYRGWTHKSPT